MGQPNGVVSGELKGEGWRSGGFYRQGGERVVAWAVESDNGRARADVIGWARGDVERLVSARGRNEGVCGR